MRVPRKWLIGFRIGEGLISGRRSTGEAGNVGRESLRDRQPVPHAPAPAPHTTQPFTCHRRCRARDVTRYS